MHSNYLNRYAILPFSLVLATIIKEQCSRTVKPKNNQGSMFILHLKKLLCRRFVFPLTFHLSFRRRILIPELQEEYTLLPLPFCTKKKSERVLYTTIWRPTILKIMFKFIPHAKISHTNNTKI